MTITDISYIATPTPAQRQKIEEALELARLVEFAGDVAQLADERRDAAVRELVNELQADILVLRSDDE